MPLEPLEHVQVAVERREVRQVVKQKHHLLLILVLILVLILTILILLLILMILLILVLVVRAGQEREGPLDPVPRDEERRVEAARAVVLEE